MISFGPLAYGWNGVQWQIYNEENKSSGDDFDEEFESYKDPVGFDDYLPEGFESILSPYEKREFIENALGKPEARAVALMLFSLAAAIEMFRITAKGGSWTPFMVRTMVVFTVLGSFREIMGGIEDFFTFVYLDILDGQSAFDVFWGHVGVILDHIQVKLSTSEGVWDYMKSIISFEGLALITTLFSALGVVVAGVLLQYMQFSLVMLFQYFGPFIIALALIVETDFTQNLIVKIIQIFSWNVVFAVLAKVIAATNGITIYETLGISDLILISVMNIVYMGMIISVPFLTQIIINSVGVGSFSSPVSMKQYAKTVGKPLRWAGDKVTKGIGAGVSGIAGGAYGMAAASVALNYKKFKNQDRSKAKDQRHPLEFIPRVEGRAPYKMLPAGDEIKRLPRGDTILMR